MSRTWNGSTRVVALAWFFSARNFATPHDWASASSSHHPALWRVFSYSRPGFPSPTMTLAPATSSSPVAERSARRRSSTPRMILFLPVRLAAAHHLRLRRRLVRRGLGLRARRAHHRSDRQLRVL